MSQNDMSVANASGATVRADINSALQALASNNSGSSAPSTMYAYQWWADTTTGVLKQRNAANSGWLVRGTLAEAFVIARSSNTILAAADVGKFFNCTSTFTQTLTAAATLGDGWWAYIRNNGSGVITIDPNSSETIDGATTVLLSPGEGCFVICNGTLFVTIGRVSISALDADATPDAAADYVMTYDNSATRHKKVLLSALGKVVQTVSTMVVTSTTGATALPQDDTIPQNTEGDEFMSKAITPTNASNNLVITVVIYLSSSGTGQKTAALFQDSTAGALAAGSSNAGAANAVSPIVIKHVMAAGTTSATTFKVRGGSASGTTTFNGQSGSRLFGGVLESSIVIQEVAP